MSPVALTIGPIEIRWYALAYIGGIVAGWLLARAYARRDALWGGGRSPVAPEALDDLFVWMALGIVIGGRLGYVLFYQPAYYLNHPLEALALWHGGMSFHGGFLGSVVALVLFARAQTIPVLSMLDLAAAVTPIGLFLGRVANFVNGELWGRPTDLPWGVVFPRAGPEPRHPSQLYEAALEGVILFVILQVMVRRGALRRPGLVAGTFVAGYGIARIIGECFRMPDDFLGFLFGGITMGMVLSVPMVVVGAAAILIALRRRPAS
jgi:phosphatidylglycerol:prolipoprotein diacylglycerol transferase